MATATQYAGNTRPYEWLDPKQLSSQKVARAASDVEVALAALGAALRERAQLGANELVSDLKRHLGNAEVGFEALIARVPALGPLVAMQLFRATHQDMGLDDMPTRPSNTLEPNETPPMLAYLECIGCHVA
jgi:hypothetical protein